MKKAENRLMKGKSTYTFQDWLDGKLDGFSNWLKPKEGEEPFAANHEGLINDIEIKKIREKQLESFEKNLKLNLNGRSTSFERRFKNLNIEKKRKAIERKIKKIEIEIIEFENIWLDKAELGENTTIGFNAETCRKIENNYREFENGSNQGKTGFIPPTFIDSKGERRWNQVFKLRSLMQFQEFLEGNLKEPEQPDPFEVAEVFREQSPKPEYSKHVIGTAMRLTRDFILENELETLNRNKSRIERHIRDNISELRVKGTSINTVKNWIDFYFERMNIRATKT